MSKNTGNEAWIEIFKGGRHVDRHGNEHDGDELIDKAIASFNANEHEPPITLGHPKHDAPAFGWVNGLKEETVKGTRVLLAKFRDVVPEFADMVNAGRYKKRSASFYPDGSLRHVGYLGAMPPAVKGLADHSFDEGEQDSISFDFSDYRFGALGRILSGIRDYLIEDKGVETADRVIPSYEIDFLKEEAIRPEEMTSAAFTEEPEKTEVEMHDDKQFSEAEVQTREEAAAEKAKEEGKREAAREFAEEQNKKMIAEFIERNFPKNGAGKLPPALLDAGVKEFMEQLDGIEVIEFAEGEEGKKTPLAWFIDFVERLPESGLFQEVAGRDKDNLPDNEDAADIAKRASEFVESEAKAGRTISISQAVAHVTKK